jgi:hypothetical protein
MWVARAITSIALIALHGTVDAGPLRACAQVAALVDGAVRPLLASAEPDPDGAQLRRQFHDCLGSRNICSVVHSAQKPPGLLVAAEVTADLPAQYGLGPGEPSVMLLARSIPPVRGDSNRYCLVSERLTRATSVHQWDVYGWVVASNANEALPLPRKVLDGDALSDPHSLRGLAAALWFFAERMSGRQPPQQKAPEESPDAAWFVPQDAQRPPASQSVSFHVWPTRSFPKEWWHSSLQSLKPTAA